MFCQFCGQPLGEGARFCAACGRPPGDAAASAAQPVYAGFWLRLAAYVIDYIVFLVGVFVAALILGVLLGVIIAVGGLGEQMSEKEWETLGGIVAYVLALPGWFLYYAWLESSSWQATLGKKLLSLQVTDLDGHRLSFARALGRNLGKILSSLILLIGFLMAAFTEKQQALHDQLAGCLVVRTK